MICKVTNCVKLRKVLESTKIINFLVWHLGKQSSPDALVEIDIRHAPSDSSQSFAMVLAIAHSQAVSTTACVTNHSVGHDWSETSQATVLPAKGILCWVSLRRVERQTAWNARTCDFLMGGDAGRIGCGRRRMVNRDRLAPEALSSAIHKVFMVLERRYIGGCGARGHLGRPIV